MNDLISVIIPVYNVENYLRECIDSVLAQTYTELEVLLVDDGSTDGSGAICDEYARQDSRVRVIHQANGGLSAARNTGLRIARGQYISFVDSDDVVGAHFLEVLYRGIQKEHTKLSVCRYLKFQDGQPRGEECRTGNTAVWGLEQTALGLTQTEGDRSIFLTIMCNKLYDRALFDTLRFPAGKLHEDEYMIHHLLLAARSVCICDAALYFYRQRRSSIMGVEGAQDLRRLQGLDAFEERCRVFRGHVSPAVYRRTVTRYFEIMQFYYCGLSFPRGVRGKIYLRYLREILRLGRWLDGKRNFFFVLSPWLFKRWFWE